MTKSPQVPNKKDESVSHSEQAPELQPALNAKQKTALLIKT